MIITGIEVLPGNPGIDIGAVPPEKVELTYGQKLRINTSFGYRGKAQKATLYGSIGKRRAWILGGFDEIIHSEAAIDLPESREFTPCLASVDVPITADINPGSDYDLYCKIKEYPEAGYPEVDDFITITGIPPTFDLIQHTIYPYAYIYDGDVEVTTATFKTDPFTPSAWLGEKFASKLEEEVRAKGGRPIEVKVYVDKTPLFWTDYRIEVIGTPLGGAVGAAPGIAVGAIPIWAAILIIALAIIAVIVVATLAIKTIVGLFKTYPGLEDVKPGWGKETLILTIHDSEEYWERTPTPAETLEGMSEAELRDYLDQIAEEEVAPEEISPWVALALIGGVGVLGVGAVVALSAARRE